MTNYRETPTTENVSFQAHPCDIDAIEKVQLHLNQVYSDNGVVRNATRSEAIRFALGKLNKDLAKGKGQ